MPDASSSVRRLKAIAILLGLVWLLNASAMPLTCNTIDFSLSPYRRHETCERSGFGEAYLDRGDMREAFTVDLEVCWLGALRWGFGDGASDHVSQAGVIGECSK